MTYPIEYILTKQPFCWWLAPLWKDWDAPIYIFFKPLPSIQYIQDRKAHIFECMATQCCCRTHFVCQFLDKSDAKSTSNLQHHAKICWSNEAIEAADDMWDIKAMHTAHQ
jgi:hypothetical protein